MAALLVVAGDDGLLADLLPALAVTGSFHVARNENGLAVQSGDLDPVVRGWLLDGLPSGRSFLLVVYPDSGHNILLFGLLCC